MPPSPTTVLHPGVAPRPSAIARRVARLGPGGDGNPSGGRDRADRNTGPSTIGDREVERARRGARARLADLHVHHAVLPVLVGDHVEQVGPRGVRVVAPPRGSCDRGVEQRASSAVGDSACAPGNATAPSVTRGPGRGGTHRSTAPVGCAARRTATRASRWPSATRPRSTASAIRCTRRGSYGVPVR